MIKAVFFDLYHTVVNFAPPRDETESHALKELGIEVKPEALRRPLVIADEFINNEIAHTPLRQLSDKEKGALYARYQAILLKEAGIKASEQLIMGVLDRMRQVKTRLVLFEDVMPLLTELKSKRLILGLISNVDRDIAPLMEELGLASMLQVVITSQEIGVNKPRPEIFEAALARAGVQPSEAIFIGDQYKIDIIGARAARMRGILLDRGGYFPEVTDCPRIRGLTEVVNYLNDGQSDLL